MELIDRYVYAVVSKLQAKQKDDVEKEVRDLINQMITNYPSEESEIEKVKKVLLELGDPYILANKYMDRKRYLIGPNNYDKYLVILKIVLGAVILGISIATGLNVVFQTDGNIVQTILDYLSTLLFAVLQVFTIITVIFAVIEHKGIVLETKLNKGQQWSLDALPKVTNRKANISKIEPIIGIIFSTLFMLIIFIAPNLFAAYFTHENGRFIMIHIFNNDVIREYWVLIVLIYITALMKEALKLIYGKWNIKLSIGYSILSTLSLILLIWLFMIPSIWNPNFGVEIAKYLNLDNDITLIRERMISGFLILIIGINILDIASALYKGIKYN